MAEANGSDYVANPSGLFSMVASDNAEVIPPVAPRGPETMWSVAANAEAEEIAADPTGGTRAADPFDTYDDVIDSNGSGDAFDHDRFAQDDRPPPFSGWDAEESMQDTASGPFRRGHVDSVGSVFSAEPVDHPGDVIDEPDLIEDTSWAGQSRPAPDASLFSNGAHLHGAPDARRRPEDDLVQESPAGQNANQDPWIIADRTWTQPRPETAWSMPADPGPPVDVTGRDDRAAAAIDDPQGFETAILRLHPQDRERAHVSLSVCGALLDEDELVLGVVTGQMLGRPAAVVVTEFRVLVVNDRRWQPVVDIFPIDGELVVRGRHDREIAALSFADPTRVSMVDGITEVAIAIELAEHIRDAGPRGAS